MTLEEAIRHAVEVSEDGGCFACRTEHRQLAVWLMELLESREILTLVRCPSEDVMAKEKFRYSTVEGLQEIQRYGSDGWRVVAADFKMGVWTALMELTIPESPG